MVEFEKLAAIRNVHLWGIKHAQNGETALVVGQKRQDQSFVGVIDTFVG